MSNFVPAPGTIYVAPEKADKAESGVVLQVRDKELPIGRVVAIGKKPRRYRFDSLAIGDRIHYSRSTSNDVWLDLEEGKTLTRCIFWEDLRGRYKTAGNEKRFAFRFHANIAAIMAIFSSGFVFGVLFSVFGAVWHAIRNACSNLRRWIFGANADRRS